MDSFGPNIKQKISTQYSCVKCNYNTVRKNNYDKHMLSSKHNMDSFGPDIKQKISTQYSCIKCNYNTVRKNNYDVHMLSSKHKSAQMLSSEYECNNCDKTYQTLSGLRKHEKKCIIELIPSDKELIMDVLQQNKELNKLLIEQTKKAEEQSKQNAELHEKIIELCKNGAVNINNSNNNNKSFNLNFFLNETCKDAMNISDFAKSIVLQLSDIDAIGEVGYVNRITSIIASHLNSLAENRRPIHCTDVKREVMYVKDQDKWERDENKKKLRLLIRKMDRMLGPLMATYGANFMKGYHSDVEYIKYNDIVKEVYGGKNEESVNEDTIIRNISKIEGLRPLREGDFRPPKTPNLRG